LINVLYKTAGKGLRRHRSARRRARPIIYHLRGATCWQPRLKGLATMSNSIYNGWRLEDLWLEQ
jgi:hypothetical protein